jgi:hypothetical protein
MGMAKATPYIREGGMALFVVMYFGAALGALSILTITLFGRQARAAIATAAACAEPLFHEP